MRFPPGGGNQKTKTGPAPLHVQGLGVRGWGSGLRGQCLEVNVQALRVGVWGWATSASATLKWGPKASPASATTFGGLGSLATECYVYFVLSPAGAGLILLLVCNQNIRFVFCDFRLLAEIAKTKRIF